LSTVPLGACHPNAFDAEQYDGAEAVAKRDLVSINKFTLRMLARRAIELEEEVAEIDALLKPMVEETAPALAAMSGVGIEVASALLVAAGDNPERLRNEASLAHLCGTSPIDASSGKHERHRLNRGGDRQANSALWHIVITRMVSDPRTRHYIGRRMKEGQTKKEAIRCDGTPFDGPPAMSMQVGIGRPTVA
jgi:transposase